MRVPLLLALLSAPASLITAQNDAAPRRAEFDSLLAAHSHPITLDGTALRGAGFDWLLREAGNANYFLIGEQHLTRELTLVEGAILARLPALGYGRFAVEVGPWSTPFAEAQIRAGTLESYLSRADRALVVPFLFLREFAAMTSAFVRAVPGEGPVLMGLDQEFIGAGPIAAEILAAETRSPAERAAAETFATAVRAQPFLVGQSDGSAIRAAQRVFAENGSARARALLDDLLLSNAVYAPFTGRGGTARDGNVQRESYLKRNFLTQLERDARAGNTSKVVGVFGANHAIRGFSPTQVLGLGNFIEELATGRGERFFNLHVDCLGGTMRNPQSGEAVPCPSYFLGDSSVLREALKHDTPTLIDLRPFRARLGRYSFLSERERTLILGFDAYLAMPNVTPATLFSRGEQ